MAQAQSRLVALSLTAVQDAAQYRGRAYLRAILAPEGGAQIKGDRILLPVHRYAALRATWAKDRPKLWAKIKGLARELVRWKAAGYRIVHWTKFLARTRACAKCPFSQGRLVKTCGRCGCTRAKLFLDTARCPEGRWPN